MAHGRSNTEAALPGRGDRRAAMRVVGSLVAFLLAALLPPAAQGQAQAQGGPVTCSIGMNIEDLYDLDMARDTFGAILWIWSLCPSDAVQPLEAIAFPTASSSTLGPVETVGTDAGETYSSRRVQGTFRYNWNMDHYPFDRQRIVIPIDETRYTAQRLLFEADSRQSFLTPDIRDRLDEWEVSDLTLEASISEEESTYGLPGAEGARYARLEAGFTLERGEYVPFLKLTSGVFAAAFIAFLSFFYDPNDRGGFGGKLGLLIGVLFSVLVNLRAADTTIGDASHMTLVTRIHLITLVFIVVLALVAVRDRRRVEGGREVAHPDWGMLGITGCLYVLIVAGMILRAALS